MSYYTVRRCPFCDSQARLGLSNSDDWPVMVCCLACGASVQGRNNVHAISLWNARIKTAEESPPTEVKLPAKPMYSLDDENNDESGYEGGPPTPHEG